MMKRFTILFIAVLFGSCAKEELYGPQNLKNGQVVELLVNHQYGATDDKLLLSNKDAGASLVGFEERQPGYTYRVKAKFVNTKEPLQDSPSYWFEYLSTVSKDQYKGTDPFEIQLIQSFIPGGPTIQMNKKDNNYYFMGEKIQLTYNTETVKAQLEEIWQNALATREYISGGAAQIPKWKSVKVTVVHDQQNFGKAYLVQRIQFEQ
jgi:hypothetical protein